MKAIKILGAPMTCLSICLMLSSQPYVFGLGRKCKENMDAKACLKEAEDLAGLVPQNAVTGVPVSFTGQVYTDGGTTPPSAAEYAPVLAAARAGHVEGPIRCQGPAKLSNQDKMRMLARYTASDSAALAGERLGMPNECAPTQGPLQSLPQSASLCQTASYYMNSPCPEYRPTEQGLINCHMPYTCENVKIGKDGNYISGKPSPDAFDPHVAAAEAAEIDREDVILAASACNHKGSNAECPSEEKLARMAGRRNHSRFASNNP